ncbi:MAG: flavodoxin family protein [Candidatus Cloacimonetes bacterium]|nr:flavodoxin family protein [Candidatus Cloacimonadota bacterium]
MKILAIYGSPDKEGITATIVETILESVNKKHEIDRIYLYDKEFHDCIACDDAKAIHLEKFCIFDDWFREEIIPAINAADILIISSPVYMGQITGKLKTMFDRWHTYIGPDFNIRILPGKKYIAVTACAAPADMFKSVSEYLDGWLSRFFKMEKIDVLHVGDMTDRNALKPDNPVMLQAKETGKKI